MYCQKGLLTNFGTPGLVDQVRHNGRAHAHPLLPSVDTRLNETGATDDHALRRQLQIRDEEIVTVTVSRLASLMKAESLRRMREVVRNLGSALLRRFVAVGDGAECKKLQALAEEANRDLGRYAILLSGPLFDPRKAFPAADIVAGMEGSALPALAFAKPVIVVDERRCADQLSSKAAATFIYTGRYHFGNGVPGNVKIARHIRGPCASPKYRVQLGFFSRNFVLERTPSRYPILVGKR